MLADEFLDLVHFWLLEHISEPENRTKVDRILLGPLLTMENDDRVIIVDKVSGMVPPIWWQGDAVAAENSISAAVQMRMGR